MMRLATRTLAVVLSLSGIALAILALDDSPTSTSEKLPRSTAESQQAWQHLLKSSQTPRNPDAWNTHPPTQEEFLAFRAHEADRMAKAAQEAQEFATRFPNDPNTANAKTKEYELLQIAAQMGNTNVFKRLDVVETARLQDSSLPQAQRYQLRLASVTRRATAELSNGLGPALAELEKGARGLVKEFPDRPDAYQMLFIVASRGEPLHGRDIAKELIQGAAPAAVKQSAEDFLKQTARIGKPVDIKFAAVDGRQVDVTQLHGKVVLVDFWATWCGPCVGEVPHVRATYDKYHPKGFEIVGISLDRKKDDLQHFVQEHSMSWPQYFDGKQWGNDYARQFEIESIPTMWLLDKKGQLRDVNARDDLEQKIAKLLAETP